MDVINKYTFQNFATHLQLSRGTPVCRGTQFGKPCFSDLQLCRHLPPLTAKAKQIKSIGLLNTNQRLKITKFG